MERGDIRFIAVIGATVTRGGLYEGVAIKHSINHLQFNFIKDFLKLCQKSIPRPSMVALIEYSELIILELSIQDACMHVCIQVCMHRHIASYHCGRWGAGRWNLITCTNSVSQRRALFVKCFGVGCGWQIILIFWKIFDIFLKYNILKITLFNYVYFCVCECVCVCLWEIIYIYIYIYIYI